MRQRIVTIVVVSLGIFAATLGMRERGWLQDPELRSRDWYVRHAPVPEAADSRIVVVEITEEDIRELNYPISDRDLADGLNALVRADARVIGLDIYRDLPVPPGTARLDALLRREPRILAVRKSADSDSDGIPGPSALRGTGRLGFNDQLLDPDGVMRRGLLFLDDGNGKSDYAFALRVVIAALEPDGVHPAPDPEHPEWLRLGPTTIPPFAGNDGGYAGEDDAGYQFLLDFAESAGGFDTIRFGSLLRGEIEPERFRDRIVLVGVNARSLPDVFLVPLRNRAANEKHPGVELHAHLVDQLMRYGRGESEPIHVVPDSWETATILLAALLGALLGSRVRRAPAIVGAVMAGAAVVATGGAWAYWNGWWISTFSPGLAWVGSVGIATAWTSSRERAERAQIMQLFSRMVSPEVAEEIWLRRAEFFREGRLRSQRVTATVLFLDMKDYTPHAQKMDPEQLMEWVNGFMEPMADAVRRHGGVVDDYFGDGLKANFGVPIPSCSEQAIRGDACRAVDCGLEMASELDRLNRAFRTRGLPTVAVRVGIHTGALVVGSLGSADRLKYTSVGDVVVTAQRLESLEGDAHDYEQLPFRILISSQTLSQLGSRYATRALGFFSLKGMEEQVEAYRVEGRVDRPGIAPGVH